MTELSTARVRKVAFAVSRPNEYTTWKPRRERGYRWTTYAWGVFRVTVER